MSTDQPGEIDLDAIDARANAATDGPWECEPWGSQGADGPIEHRISGTVGRDAEVITVACTGYDAIGSRDGEFIAHARTDIPALVAEVRRLRALVGPTRESEAAHAHLCDLQAQRDAALALHVRIVRAAYPGGSAGGRCAHDDHVWPCATARALGVTA